MSSPAPDSSAAPAGAEMRAGLFMIAGVSLVAIQFAIIKHLAADLPQPVIALWRSGFAVLLFIPRVAREGWSVIATTRLWSHAWRSLFGFLSFLSLIYALTFLRLGDAVAISFTTSFWSILLGVLVFRERLPLRLAVAVAIGFVGVVLIARPSGGVASGLGALLALLSAIMTSLAMMMVKQLTLSEPPDRIAFYFMLGGTVFALPVAAFQWAWPAPAEWLPLLACAVMFFFGQIFVARAYALGTFSRVAPLDLSRLPVSLAIGLLWFNEVPTALALGGMVLIALASLDILLQTHRAHA